LFKNRRIRSFGPDPNVNINFFENNGYVFGFKNIKNFRIKQIKILDPVDPDSDPYLITVF